MAISKSTVIKLILKYIGGNPLIQIPTTMVAGQPVAIKAGLDISSILTPKFAQLASDLEAGLSEIEGIASDIQSNLGALEAYTEDIGGLAQTDLLAPLANQIAGSTGGIQQGLSLMSQNPLESSISSTKNTISNYSQNGYTKLDELLPDVAGNASLTTAYNNLKNAIGGPDGRTGAGIQLNAYKAHTDRLSGVTISSDSEFYDEEESGEETAVFYNVSAGVPTKIVSFSADKMRSAKYFVQGSSGLDHQTSEVYVIHDSFTVYTREVGLIYTRNPFIYFSSRLVNNVVSVTATTTISGVDLVVYGVRLPLATESKSDNKISQEKILESATSLAGFYPNDTTDYVRKQASSLMEPTAFKTLEQQIKNVVTNLSNNSFNSLNDSQKAEYINNYANTINNLTKAMQASIDSDIEGQKEVDKKLEAASTLYSVSSSYYSDSNARALLDLTLKNSVKRAL